MLLAELASVFQAEVYAINACVLENLSKNYLGRKILILSYSQVTLKALARF